MSTLSPQSTAAIALALVAGLGGMSLPLAATPIRDQEQATAHFSYSFGTGEFWQQLGQTFTAGVDGMLTGLELRLGRMPGSVTTGSLSIEIRTTETGPASTGQSYLQTPIVGGQRLASATLNTVDVPVVDPTLGQVAPFSPLITFATPVSVRAGVAYSILLYGNGADQWVWSLDLPASTYGGGNAFARVGNGYAWSFVGYAGNPPTLGDFGFRTYVERTAAPVSEPMTLSLWGLGLAGLAWRRRRLQQVAH
ncbi:PEP-CTERM sorting domain-containing protein [Candidatus Contendibacter odensensis]|uniref:PEP-CTERM protein-sorting domain-containing protein n=1 Tax=Candidatus Contendobacter odensis Run_B_J11 TaxID=1400861 RepID=A0A7U7J3T3_9GAMM|nr:PEP-CTERM sorting domain-containing protein [Candidatus Contendobacter odensis]MBK8752219.1 PEP-CTERM sorting domain-containing protein [Candidatus Competibacteraceae bacterium]CDH45513.1 exported hypothetical protein [Candidatus Contendobacter odensis Run_B_J11]